MSVRALFGLAVVLAVLAVGAAYWVRHLERAAAADVGDAARIEALLAARSALYANVLAARAGLELSFDDINGAVLALRGLSTGAAIVRSRGAAYARGANELAQAAEAWLIEEGALETFKTNLALLRLSSQYFPVAADACMGGPAQPDEQTTAISALRTDVARYEAGPTPELTQRVGAAIAGLQVLVSSKEHGDDDSAEPSAVLGHARAILDRRERVDRFARNLARSPVRVHLEAARVAHAQAGQRPFAMAGALRLVASALAALGVFVFGAAAWRARRRGRRTSWSRSANR